MNSNYSKPYRMSHHGGNSAYYEKVDAELNDYRSAAQARGPQLRGHWYPSYGEHGEEDEEPGGLRSSDALRVNMNMYGYATSRQLLCEPSWTDRTTRFNSDSNEYRADRAEGIYYDHHHGNSRKVPYAKYPHGKADGASFGRSSSDHYVPSLVDSETSSFEQSHFDDDHWNEKVEYSPIYNRRRYAEPPEQESTHRYLQSTLDAGPKIPYEHAISKRETSFKTIEVLPGEFLRLRGADETWRAVQTDFYMPCECVCCRQTLFCIQDAVFVLCPDCRVVSPMEGILCEESDGGVGLGFKLTDLAKWQDEIAKERMVASMK